MPEAAYGDPPPQIVYLGGFPPFMESHDGGRTWRWEPPDEPFPTTTCALIYNVFPMETPIDIKPDDRAGVPEPKLA